MQQFTVVLTVTVNTTETVSTTELKEALTPLVESFDSGTIKIEIVQEN